MHALDQVARLRLPLDEHSQVELRQRGPRCPLDLVDEPARGFEREHSRGGDTRVAQQARPGTAHADRAHLAHSVHGRDATRLAARPMIAATRRAAAESAHANPILTPTSPASTPTVARTSDQRLVASARRASLLAWRPTLRSTAARPSSMKNVAIRSANA